MPDTTNGEDMERDDQLIEFTCERCGFKYHKKEDYQPHLCYRCLRFIAKNTFKTVHQIVPPVSRAEVSNV